MKRQNDQEEGFGDKKRYHCDEISNGSYYKNFDQEFREDFTNRIDIGNFYFFHFIATKIPCFRCCIGI